MIKFVDDKKGKHMSHEAHFTAESKGPYCYSDIEIIGYGATKDESLHNLKLAMADIAAQIAEAHNVM